MNSKSLDSAVATQLSNIEKNTGKKTDYWIKQLLNSGFTKHGELVKFLKEKHGFTHGNANLLALISKNNNVSAPEDLVTAQFKDKENLKAWYDKIIAEIKKFGKDIEIAPKKSYVSIRRKKQFAIIQPSTKTRLDVGLNLKAVKTTAGIEPSGSWNSMCTHRIKIEDGKKLNKEIIGWIRQAYEQAG